MYLVSMSNHINSLNIVVVLTMNVQTTCTHSIPMKFGCKSFYIDLQSIQKPSCRLNSQPIWDVIQSSLSRDPSVNWNVPEVLYLNPLCQTTKLGAYIQAPDVNRKLKTPERAIKCVKGRIVMEVYWRWELFSDLFVVNWKNCWQSKNLHVLIHVNNVTH